MSSVHIQPVRDRVEDEHSVVVSTAHPAKFNDIVEKEIGREIAIPANLYEIMHSESRAKSIAPDYRNLF